MSPAMHAEPTVRKPSAESEQQAEELRALTAQYSPPDDAEVKADYRWVYELSETLPDDWPYWDTGVAVYNREIVGTGRDWVQLKIDLSKKLGVSPWRIVVTCLGNPWKEPA